MRRKAYVNSRKFVATLAKLNITTVEELRLAIVQRTKKRKSDKEYLLDKIAWFVEPPRCSYEKCNHYSVISYCDCRLERNPAQCKEFRAHKVRSDKYTAGLERNRPDRQVKQLIKLCEKCIEDNEKWKAERKTPSWLTAKNVEWPTKKTGTYLTVKTERGAFGYERLKELWLEPKKTISRLSSDHLLIEGIKHLPKLPHFYQRDPISHLKMLYKELDEMKKDATNFAQLFKIPLADHTRGLMS